MATPESEVNTSAGEVEATVKGHDRVRPVQAIAQEMLLAFAEGDARTATSLVREADRDYPNHPGLSQARAKCQAVVERAQWLADAINQMDLDFEEDHFASAVGRFREALCLSQGLPRLKIETENQAVRHSEKLLPRNWRVAETLLHEAATAVPDFSPKAELREKLRRARIDELVTIALHQADKAEFTGNAAQARTRLLSLIEAYPGEKRLVDKLSELNTPRQVVKRDGRDLAAAAKRRATPADPVFEGITPQGLRNFAAIAGTSAMLGLAGFLLWQHFSGKPGTATPAMSAPAARAAAKPQAVQPVPSRTDVPPPPMAEPAAQDDLAWNAIKTSDSVPSLKAFIATYPLSPHALRARVKLAAIDWGRVDKSDTEALEAYLRANPHGFYKFEAKRLILRLNAQKIAAAALPATEALSDHDAILKAVRVFQENAPGTISPGTMIDEPVIDGNQATVQVRQPDGSASGSSHSFSVLKIDGRWRVIHFQ